MNETAFVLRERGTDDRERNGNAQRSSTIDLVESALMLRRSSVIEKTAAVPDPQESAGAARLNTPPPGVFAFPVPRRPPRSTTTFYPLQEWEGYVTAIDKDSFTTRLVDITAGETRATETATIPLTEISNTDADKMEIGSFFRWVIGYRRDAAGTKYRVSVIVFRELPVMTKARLRRARAWAEKIRTMFPDD